jgi:hypothetical protein
LIDPTAKFEHIWHSIMRVLFGTNPGSHRSLWLRNKSILHDVTQLMGRK